MPDNIRKINKFDISDFICKKNNVESNESTNQTFNCLSLKYSPIAWAYFHNVLQNETDNFPKFANHYKYHDFIPAKAVVALLFYLFWYDNFGDKQTLKVIWHSQLNENRTRFLLFQKIIITIEKPKAFAEMKSRY